MSDAVTRYLNTDMDLVAGQPLERLAAALEERSLVVLYLGHGEEGQWRATFEADAAFDGPEANIVHLLSAVESLPPEHRALWQRCKSRELNVGYDCGATPWAFNQAVGHATLQRMAALGVSLRITLYPAEREQT